MNPNSNPNYNEPPPYDVSDYLEGLTPPVSSTPPPPPKDPASPSTSTSTSTSNSNSQHRHNPFLSPSNNFNLNSNLSTALNKNNNASSFSNSFLSPSKPSTSPPSLNHSHSAPYLTSNVTGSSSNWIGGNYYENIENNNNNNNSSNFNQNLSTSNLQPGRMNNNNRATSDTNVLSYGTGNQMNEGMSNGSNYLTSSNTGGSFYNTSASSNTASSNSRIVSAPIPPPRDSSIQNNPNLLHPNQTGLSSSSSPPALPDRTYKFTTPVALVSSSMSTVSPAAIFANKLNSTIDESFSQLESQMLTSFEQLSHASSPSTSIKKGSGEEDPMTSAFLTSFPSLDEGHQSPSIQIESNEPSRNISSSVDKIKIDMKMKVMLIIKEELERRDTVVRVQLEKEVMELKESNLVGMKNLLSLAQERDKLGVTNDRLRLELSTAQSSISENLQNSFSAAVLLQERIDILQLALNEETSTGSHSRQQTELGVQAEGDNIWSEIVDEQSKALAKQTKAITSLSQVLTCSICSELFTDPTTIECGHSFCKVCITDWIERGNRNCAECRFGITGTDLKVNFVVREVVKELKEVGLGEEDD